MHAVTLAEILPPVLYEPLREARRRAIIDLKKTRRVALGGQMTLVFENTDTVRFQIQEMVRAERLTDPAAITLEINTYNALLPRRDELAATLFLEITGSDTIADDLLRFRGLENDCLFLDIGDAVRIPATFALDGLTHPGKLAAVHDVRFPLGPEGAALVSGGCSPLTLRIDHPQYAATTTLTTATHDALREDLC